MPLALRLLLGAAATAAAVVLLAATLDTVRLWAGAGALLARPADLAAFAVLYAACFWLRALAWRVLLAPGRDGQTEGERAHGWRLFSALHVALAVNHLLPVKLGEAVRPLLAARHGAGLQQAIASTAAARVLDLACLLAIASVLLAGSGWGKGLATPAIPALGILTAATSLLCLAKLLLPAGPLARITAPRLALASLWTLPSWVLEGSVLFIAADAMGIEVSVQAAVAATAFAILFQAVQLTPGGIGVYEAAMTGALVAHGVPAAEGLAVSTLAHAMKFAYAYLVGGVCALLEAKDAGWLKGLDALRGSAREVKGASSLEVVMARLWNVVNEGKPFTPLFTLFVVLLLSIPRFSESGYALRAIGAAAALTPLLVIFFRFDFPLKLRTALWVYLALGLAVFRGLDLAAAALVLVLYLGFTIGLWGTVYYHLRMGMPWTNFLRFWRLVLENPDPTSGNFLEQVPKVLLLVLLFQHLASGPSPGHVLAAEGFIALVGVSAVLAHQRFATWAPPPPLAPTRVVNHARKRHARRVIAIVIDGCRADRFLEARTPFCDRLRLEGTAFTDMQTVYPARTTTCFSSMLTGAPPRVHGMRSNFVPSLGVKCDSIFTSFARQGLSARLVGIAHLIDAFGAENVATVTATMKNDEIDLGLVARAKEVMRRDNPDLLVLQLLSVDQTGHARGSYNAEYLQKIEESDRIIEEFLGWCRTEGYLEGATVLITADHGQGIGIGGHGHLSRTEVRVPCILWGAEIPPAVVRDEPRSIIDIAPTISYFLGALPPEQSVGQTLLTPSSPGTRGEGPEQVRPLAIIIPCLNEAESLPRVLSQVPSAVLPGAQVIVVDDGSTDGSAAFAEQLGARVVRHGRRRGLGAALRTGLDEARRMDARAAVYLDADMEYDPAEIPALLAPIERGEADYVLGSRFSGAAHGMSLGRRVANRAFSLLLSAAAGRWISDGQTGFRAFGARALATAEIIHDYNYAQVLTLDLLRKGMRMAQVPITYRRRTAGRSFITAQYLWRIPLGMVKEMLSD